MNNKLVSVIIPSYSRPNNICRAIDSVLNQTYQPIEIIVVDDNGIGTDFQRQTEHVLSKYIRTNKIIYIKHDTNKMEVPQEIQVLRQVMDITLIFLMTMMNSLRRRLKNKWQY